MGKIIHSDGWRGYIGLVDLGDKKHFRVRHGKKVLEESPKLTVLKASEVAR